MLPANDLVWPGPSVRLVSENVHARPSEAETSTLPAESDSDRSYWQPVENCQVRLSGVPLVTVYVNFAVAFTALPGHGVVMQRMVFDLLVYERLSNTSFDV